MKPWNLLLLNVEKFSCNLIFLNKRKYNMNKINRVFCTKNEDPAMFKSLLKNM